MLKGNTKLVESIKLKDLYPRQLLKMTSLNKKITRHFTNSAYYLSPDEYTMFNFVVFMSDSNCIFNYSTELLKMYDKATSRAIEIYGACRVSYKTSTTNARNSFISLIEKGLIIRLSKGKNRFMINPYVVHSSIKLIDFNKIHKNYLEIIEKYKGEELSDQLTIFCDSIDCTLEKEKARILKAVKESKKNES